MANVTIEAVILSYNRAGYLRDCIRSVLAQTFRDFRLTVLDNASDQDVRGVVESFADPRLRLVVNESNIGVLANWRKAYDSVGEDAEFFMIFHDDDTMPTDLFESQVRVFRSHDDLSFVGTGVRLVTDHAVMLDYPEPGEPRYEILRPGKLLEECFGSKVFGFGCILYKTSGAKAIQPDQERFANIFDRAYMLALNERHSCAYMESPYINARCHPEQDSALRLWTVNHEIELGRYFVEVNRHIDRDALNDAVTKHLVQNYVTRSPRPPLSAWIRHLSERNVLFWKPLVRYLPYYSFRTVIVRFLLARAAPVHRFYIRNRSRVSPRASTYFGKLE